MRVTLDIEDDVLAAVRAIAAERGTRVGRELSEIARRALRPVEIVEDDDWPVFEVASDAPLITPAMVKKALDEA